MASSRCDILIEKGLYRNYNITSSGNFSVDFRSYFESNEFKSDLQRGNWGGSFSIGPYSIGAAANDAQVTEFQQKVLKEFDFNLVQSYYRSMTATIPDTELARLYVECVQRTQGFSVSHINGSDNVGFVVNYDPQFFDEHIPIVKLLKVTGANSVQTVLKEGKEIGNSNLIYCARNPDSDVLLFLETDRGVITDRIPAFSPLVPTIFTYHISIESTSISTIIEIMDNADWVKAWESYIVGECPSGILQFSIDDKRIFFSKRGDISDQVLLKIQLSTTAKDVALRITHNNGRSVKITSPVGNDIKIPANGSDDGTPITSQHRLLLRK